MLLVVVVISCRWRILRETLAAIVWSVWLVKEVVRMVSVIIQWSRFYLGISKASESSILSKLLLHGRSFFLAWAKIVRNQCHVMDSSILEMLRHLLISRIAISSSICASTSYCSLWSLWTSRSWLGDRMMRLLRLWERRNLALIGKMRLSRHRLKK